MAVERHHNLNGSDHDVSAKAAGHNKEKASYYKKVSYEEQESYAKHHPALIDGGKWLFHTETVFSKEKIIISLL